MKRSLLIICVAISLGACAGRQVRQPRMERAKDLLEGAMSSLREATSDKGGHRARAIEEIQAAIVEVNAGIQFDDTH
ncbi:MAG: hypothetical protein QM817_37790 [Archangium sp.]